jgi:methylated-DNA-[protein]-cysteine S-methyltransferase
VPIKKKLHELLDQGRFEQIAAMASEKKRVLGILVSLTFDPDPQIGWRAVEAMGVTADRIAEDDPEYVRGHLRRLYWLLSEESGGICWRAPEAMAEIVRHRPKLFADYALIVVSLIREMAEEDLDHFRAGALWAIGRLGAVAGDHIQAVLSSITSALDDSDPQVRGMAVWCLGQVGQAKLLADRSDLLSDEGPVDLYEDGRLKRTSVCDLVRRALCDRPVEVRNERWNGEDAGAT